MLQEGKIVINDYADLVQMENGQNMNATGKQDGLMIKAHNQRDLIKSSNDVLAHRLKNRERQRRYRARKRLEADRKKSSVLNHSITPQIDLQSNGNLSNYVARVHCKRDWKKEARRASIPKGLEDPTNGYVQPTISSTENQTLLPSGNMAEAQAPQGMELCPSFTLVSCETTKTNHGRRDWKADARNRKNDEEDGTYIGFG